MRSLPFLFINLTGLILNARSSLAFAQPIELIWCITTLHLTSKSSNDYLFPRMLFKNRHSLRQPTKPTQTEYKPTLTAPPKLATQTTGGSGYSMACQIIYCRSRNRRSTTMPLAHPLRRGIQPKTKLNPHLSWLSISCRFSTEYTSLGSPAIETIHYILPKSVSL